MAKRKAKSDANAWKPVKRSKKQASDAGDPTAPATTESAKRASLLGLPPELRNEIWRYVLIEPGWVEMWDATDAEQPGLMRVNNQLRNETMPIFREENEFCLVTDGLKFAPQRGHWVWSFKAGRMNFSYSGPPSWTNLKEWLHAYWKDSTVKGMTAPPDVEDEDLDETYLAIFQAFAMVEALRTDDVVWDTVERVIESLKKFMDATLAGWID